MEQPGCVVFHAQVATEIERGGPSFCLTDRIKGQEPEGQRQFCGLHDQASRERGLMAAVPALVTLETPALDEPMLMALAAWTAKAIRPPSLLQSGLTLLPGAIEPLELKGGVAFLKLDAAARNAWTGRYAPAYVVMQPGVERAE